MLFDNGQAGAGNSIKNSSMLGLFYEFIALMLCCFSYWVLYCYFMLYELAH
ncbi:hypothetical protein NT01EI_3299 [Edwardsiella ictaluri 93-146]|uniref:Uncharacterized protein n=1 Tax=Edwardsiella ictaluri (strain 93-146) TaxID=634503 RepID=C5B910_EDWI9|nr:hypothetical protein NT01EI_3299 [Edwardsiella ictaluri 93-146]